MKIPATRRLGMIKREIGTPEQSDRVFAIGRGMCNPHARAYVHELSLDEICPLDKVEDPGCDRCRFFEGRRRADQHGKFVCAQACNNITLPGGCLQPLGSEAKQGVPGRMPKSVVD